VAVGSSVAVATLVRNCVRVSTGVSVGGGASVGVEVGSGTAVLVAITAAASRAELTSAVAPTRYMAVENRKRIAASEARVAPRLESPSYHPQP